jgi:hypothetical protein
MKQDFSKILQMKQTALLQTPDSRQSQTPLDKAIGSIVTSFAHIDTRVAIV